MNVKIKDLKGGIADVAETLSSLNFNSLIDAAKNTEKDKREQAEKLGIIWERPDGDNRSAQYIIDNNPVLRDLGNQENLRDDLKKQVGDFENDPDAAFRAVQVLEHIEKFDGNGELIVGNSVGDGRINGVTSGGDVRHGTEAGRLKDFNKFGFENLKGDLGNRTRTSEKPETREKAEALGLKWNRPGNDSRSAQEILNDTPALKNLENKSGVKDMLKDQVGDYETDADAAYRAAQVIEHIQRFDGDGNAIVGADAGNGKIDGFTSSDEARHGTEAGRLQDFGRDGFDSLKGKMVDREKLGDDTAARDDAERLGIRWERPEGDDRSARDILDDDPLLANLGNQSGVKDMLKDRVGDYERDADAAYRASQVLEHIERFYGDGKSIVGKDVGNDKIDGFGGEEAENGTEAGRLQDFGKYGFENLKGQLNNVGSAGDDKMSREKAEELGIQWERPEGDDRSARDIIDDSRVLKGLGNQSGVKDMLKEQVGDFETDADAAYRAVQVLDHIERLDGEGKTIAGKSVDNGVIDGFTSSDEARPDTEAGRLQDFGKLGFDSLKGKLTDRTDATTNDEARKQAEDLGIVWERRDGDERSAREIIQDTPILRDLGNQSGAKDMLKDRVGDYENDADAAFRAAQVLEHIERFDGNGKELSGSDVGNGRVDGFTSSREARPGTEAGRLQDFGKFGFGNLKGKLKDRSKGDDTPVANEEEARAEAEKLGIEWKRPDSDYRLAEEIIGENPILKGLGDDENLKEMMKERVGDYEKDADAAYRAVQVIEHVERFDGDGNRIVGKDVGNDTLDGMTGSGEARHGTEAGRLKDFGKYGFSSLKGDLSASATVNDNSQSREKAEKLGIHWERTEGDTRTASEIINEAPSLKNLDNTSGTKDLLKEQVGDFEKDADAAYRAAQVLEHIQRFDENGETVLGKSVGDGEIEGFTSSGEAKHGTEAGRLQDFGKYGFDSLKGVIPDRSAPATDESARAEAEKLGIEWERPEGDDRSAAEIMGGSELLRNLGNESGTRDMLKDRVGDFENDADAAYRAVQVLDYIETYSNGGVYNESGNGKIDGFTSSGEAEHGSEAGRLQDFGKYGFSALDHTSNRFEEYLKDHPDADATSQKITEYASILYDNFGAIQDATDTGQFIEVSDLEKFKAANPDLPDKTREAIDFWMSPGAFERLETSVDTLRYPIDGLLTKEDIGAWIKNSAPTDVSGAMQFLNQAAQGGSVAGFDVDKYGPEIFEKPERYSGQEKAAVVQDLQRAYMIVSMGKSSGVWKDAQSSGKLDKFGDDPDKLLEDIESKLDILMNDNDVVKYFEENGNKAMTSMLGGAKGLQDELKQSYEDEILSGKALDAIWEKNKDKEGATKLDALNEFYTVASSMQTTMGVDDTKAIQDAVAKSDVGKEMQTYFTEEVVTGKRLDALLKDNDPQKALSTFSLEVALLNTTLPAELTEKHSDTIDKLIIDKTVESLENELTFDDLKTAYGVNGTDKLDEAKISEMFDHVVKESPELVTNEDGKVVTRDEFLTGFRGAWDTMRQGVKVGDKMGWITDGALKGISDRGVMHGVSGLFLAGLTISRGIAGGQDMTPRAAGNIALSSIQTTAILGEGGMKGWQTYLKNSMPATYDVPTQGQAASNLAKEQTIKNLKVGENAFKIAGGVTGIVTGVLSIVDGVKALRNGDKVGGGMSIASGGLGAISGLAAAAEGVIGLASASKVIGTIAGVTAGVAGATAAVAGVAALVMAVVLVIIQEVEKDKRTSDFASLLDGHLDKYGITGKG